MEAGQPGQWGVPRVGSGTRGFPGHVSWTWTARPHAAREQPDTGETGETGEAGEAALVRLDMLTAAEAS